MKRRLDRSFHPPAPMVPVEVRAPNGVDAARLDGKIDTGADVCAVPERLVRELALPPVRTVRAAGFGGVLEEVLAYRIDLDIDGMSFPRVEALATRRAYAIIGRNVLQRVVLRVDGPGGVVDVRTPSQPRRGL